MADNDAISASGAQPSQLGVLNGIWFRRERERIAVGRPAVAAHIGVPVGRVVALETKNQAVPQQWLSLLPALGFQLPSLLLPSQEAKPVDSPAEPAPPISVPVTLFAERTNAVRAKLGTMVLPAATGQTSLTAAGQTAVPPAAEQGLQVAEAGSVQRQATTRAAQPPTTPSTTTKASAPAKGQLPPAPHRARGLWLRGRRSDLGHSLRTMSKALRVSEHDYGVLEWQNLLIPPAWVSTLVTLRIFDPSALSLESQGPKEGHPTGAWLRPERQRNGYSIESCAKHLGVRNGVLALVELHHWPVLPEWLPILSKLGFVGPNDAPSPVVASADAIPESTPPPEKKNVKTSTEHGDANCDQQPKPAPVTGAWLRFHRLKRKLSQGQLAKILKVSTWTVLTYERADKPVRADWLPLLLEIGFPVSQPSAPGAAISPPSVPGAASPPPKSAKVASAEALVLDGSWLRAERQRLGLDLSELRKALGLKRDSIQGMEKCKSQIPDSWLSALSVLGFRLPPHLMIWSIPKNEASQPLRGSWLVKARKRLNISPAQVRQALGLHRGTLGAIERYNRPLPAEWLPALKQLGLKVPGSPAAPSLSPSSNPKKSENPEPTPMGQPASLAVAVRPWPPAPLLPTQRNDLAATIMSYRLNMGRTTGKPAFQVLGWISQDVQQVGLEDLITYEMLDAAFHVLSRRRAP